MPNYLFIPVVGTKEVPLTVTGRSGLISPTGVEQDRTEHQNNIRHSELLRTIVTTMKRWRETVCTTEYFTGFTPQGARDDIGDWSWDYGIEYPFVSDNRKALTDPPRISPKASFGEVGESRIWIDVLEENIFSSHDLTFTAYGNEAFRDPITGEEISDLEVKLRDHEGFYDVSITEALKRSGGDHRERNLEYFVGGVSAGKPYVNIQKSCEKDEAELLSEPHALALFNLMDTLIPKTTCPTPQAEQRDAPEPPALPHPDRRTAGQ